ncbi:MAG: SRPBCC family protein [Nannocystaceae bacterium]|nr:SRPBCC family protein [Nannocystaceae bacterium]
MSLQVHRTRLVHAPIAPTWAAVSKMDAVADWHPNVARASVLTHNAGVDASRRVEFHDGTSVVETVMQQDEARSVTMALLEAPLLKKAIVTIRTEKKSAAETEVTFSVDYDVKYGPIGWLMGTVLMKKAFRKIFGVSLGGLAYHLETGNLVTDSVPARASQGSVDTPDTQDAGR